MLKQAFLLALICGIGIAAEARTVQISSSLDAQAKREATAIVDKITGNARQSRADARVLRAQSEARLAARDYDGAMKLRFQMLGICGNDSSALGSLTNYAIQTLAFDDVDTIASHLDAPACRKYGARLEAFDAKSPTYATQLQTEEAAKLRDFTLLTSNAADWQRFISDSSWDATEKAVLAKISTAQVKADIIAVYKVRLAEANGPYGAPANVESDPYTARFTGLFPNFRFLWTRAKTQRVLLIAALRARADRLEHRTRTLPLPADPFGNGPLQEKYGSIYSIGPDGMDDGGQFMVVYRSDEHGENGRLIPSVASKRMDYKGDIVAPHL